MIQTAQRASTKGGLCQWFLWQKITWVLWLPIKHAVTKQLSQSVMYNARTGTHLGFKKTPVPLTFMASKSPFPIHANPIASPWSEKKRVSSQMLHCGSVQTKFVTYFKRSLFSHRMSPSVALSLLILFFMGLILNAGIKEASKNRREADVWWGWHRWNDAHFSAGQPTSLFPTCL